MKKTTHRMLRTFVTMILFVAMLLTHSFALAASMSDTKDINTQRREVASYAASEDFQGIKYVYCGESTHGFDCSGFTKYIYAHFGVELPHFTGDQKKQGSSVDSKDDLLPGDLVFFRNWHHVGIFIGNGQFVHASSGKGEVVTSSLETGYYAEKYSGARRIF